MSTKRLNSALLLTLWLFLAAFTATGQTISGTTMVCNGSTTTLSGSPAGGTWSSSAVTVATVSASGVVTGTAAGVATITYDIGSGYATASVTVNPAPGSIVGSLGFCNGSTTSLSNATPGGTWMSSNPSIATVSSSGLVVGVTAGIADITYSLPTGCVSTATVTVNPTPGAISGTATVCTGSATTLSNGTAGGTWSSSNTAIATISSSTGVVSGVAAGTTTISYTLPTGCNTTIITTVNANPGAISGPSTVCVGNTTTQTNSTPGGVWSSSNIAVASITSSGVLTGAGVGTATITYTLSTGCRSTKVVTVNANPVIIGSTTLCNGSSTVLNATITGGTWSSSNASVAMFPTPSSGSLNSVSAGSVIVTYTLPSGCAALQMDTVLTAPGIITGPSTLCVGTTATLGNSVAGGTWSSSPATIATVGGTTGVVSGISSGVATITYSLSNGCLRTASETVNPTPAAITGTTTICTGTTSTLSSASAGGTWYSSSTAVATVGVSTGIVSGISAGTANITYAAGGCYTTVMVTVATAPSAGTTTSSATMCIGTTTTVSSTVSGGIWSSSNPSIATVGATTGIVTSVGAGTATLTYAVTNSCGTAIATTTVTVGAPPTITGISPVCIGLNSTLSAAAGCGTWSSGSSSVATVTPLTTSTAVVTGVAAGIATISFTSCTGCVSTLVVTIAATPPAITGSSSVCLGTTIVLDDTISGGIWNSSNPSVASISTIGTSPGTVTGLSTGTAIMTYELSPGCITTTTITVNPLPAITASTTSISCGGGYVVTASGGSSYTWLPTTGVSCSTCATTNIEVTSTTTYTVTGTNSSGCSNTATVIISGNRIYGHISFSGATPSATDLRVWLVQYNPLDSSIVAVDSTTTCMDSTSPYYQFSGKPAGSYLVKAKLLSSIPGTSDYIPTYGYSSAHWNTATTITHTSSTDSQDIRMMNGTVLSGPGFISGYVFAGAGKGTASAAPVNGILVYLKNVVTGVILNYTYTDASGKYTFAHLPYGNYFIYPEEYDYYTIPSPVITVGPTTDTTWASFKKHTDYGTITPNNDLSWLSATTITQGNFNIYPNPCSGILHIDLPQAAAYAEIVVTDATGRTVYQQNMSNITSAILSLQLQHLQTGLYILSINTGSGRFTNKFTIQ